MPSGLAQDPLAPNLALSPPARNANVVWQPALGYLYQNGAIGEPSSADVAQGYTLGDCYFLSTLGEVADHDPQLIENMIHDNGISNGLHTYAITFYHGGTAVPITVDNYLPVFPHNDPNFADQFYYAGFYQYGRAHTYSDPGNVLWVALVEKAYAQLAGGGWSRAYMGAMPSTSAYGSLEGGAAIGSAYTFDHVTGGLPDSTTALEINDFTEQAVIAAFRAGDPITMRTGQHTWMLTGVSQDSDPQFTFTNPYADQSVNSKHQPAMTLNWTGLQSLCASADGGTNAGQFVIFSGYKLTEGGALLHLRTDGTWASDPNNCTATAVAFAAYGGTVYELGTYGRLWHYQNGQWDSSYIDAGVGSIAVDGGGNLYYLTSGALYRNGPTTMVKSGVQAIVAAGDGLVYALGMDTNATVWNNWSYQNGQWVGATFTTGVQSLALDGNGALYYLKRNGNLWQYQFKTSTQVDANVTTIVVGADGAVYYLQTDGWLQRYTSPLKTTRTSSPLLMDTDVEKIVVDNTGTLYELKWSGELWGWLDGTWVCGPIEGITDIGLDGVGNLVKMR